MTNFRGEKIRKALPATPVEILGLSDVIMDIVETGTTLKENNLKILTNIEDISARFVANKSSYRFKNKKIEEIVNKIKEIL